MVEVVTARKFRKILWEICGQDTSADSRGWTKENILWGHSAVVSLLAQDLFGGELLSMSLAGTDFARLRFHYRNRFPDGSQKDFTREQFGGKLNADLVVSEAERDKVLADKATARRYNLLVERFKEKVSQDGR